MAKDWDHLSEAEKVAVINARVASGHTSVVRYEGLLRLRERERAFDEAIIFLTTRGFTEAADALEEAAFERVS